MKYTSTETFFNSSEGRNFLNKISKEDLLEYFEVKDITLIDFKELIEYIKDISGDYSEEYSLCYKTSNYTLFINKIEYVVVGKSYLKDGCICDQRMEDYIITTNLSEKEEEANQNKLDNQAKWMDFIHMATLDEIYDKVKDIKF